MSHFPGLWRSSRASLWCRFDAQFSEMRSQEQKQEQGKWARQKAAALDIPYGRLGRVNKAGNLWLSRMPLPLPLPQKPYPEPVLAVRVSAVGSGPGQEEQSTNLGTSMLHSRKTQQSSFVQQKQNRSLV